jgi:hypothetical protein
VFFVTFYVAFLCSFIADAQGFKEARSSRLHDSTNTNWLERKYHLEDLGVDGKLTLKSVKNYVYVLGGIIPVV